MKVGLVGYGTIAGVLARAMDEPGFPARLIAVTGRNEEKARAFCERWKSRPRFLPLDELISVSDLIAEATAMPDLAPLLRLAISARKDVLVMGVGRLLGCEAEIRLAEEKGVRIHVPSGAIVGLDAVQGAALGRLDRVVLTSRKPPAAFSGAPEVVARGIRLEDLKEPLILFEGPAREAVVRFPANVNVAAALSLAGLGADRTWVRVVADPGVERNIHEIELEGDFGRLLTRAENVPAPQNPKTSYLACLSAISTLRAIADPVRIGT